MNNAQESFFQVLKNCHRSDPPFKVLIWICRGIEAEVIRDEETLTSFEIWKDGHILFKGDYEQLLSNLFHYIFYTKDNE